MPIFNHHRGIVVTIGLGLLCLGIGQGCSGRNQGQAAKAGRMADSLAYAQAVAVGDEAARFAAIETFLKEHPKSAPAAEAYPALIELARKTAPEKVIPILKAFLKTDFHSPDPYNSVGWDLADAGEHLDLAVPILVKSVAKARQAGDSLALASCLDSEGWARYRAGDSKGAIGPMEEARRLYREPIDEIEEHMALIYDAAGRYEEAKPIYMNLLSHMEHPVLRENLTRIVHASGGSMAEINAELTRRRIEGAEPAADFTLPSLADGKPVTLSEHRGKVVLLNFWHYT